MADNEKHETTDISTQREQPLEAVFLVLAYLPVFELLSRSQVCRSLRDAVENDILPWLNIIVEKPLNKRLSDDFLRKITSWANGQLRTLALMNCGKISDDGLQNITEKNPNIEKVPSLFVHFLRFTRLALLYCPSDIYGTPDKTPMIVKSR